MSNDEDRSRTNLGTHLLQELQANIPGASGTLKHLTMEGSSNILSASDLKKLIRFMDQVHQDHHADTSDLKIVFGDDIRGKFGTESFADVLDISTANKLLELHDKYFEQGKSQEPKIVLRRTEAMDGCIDFHCYGTIPTYTIQITLNDDSEYSGGRLVFFHKDKLIEPKRPAGFMSVHSNDVMHGVTRVTKGVRYSLFVVDGDKGLGGSSSNIHISRRRVE